MLLEQLRKRRSDLILIKVTHVIKNQKYRPGEADYDSDFPSFADDNDLTYYHRLQGRIDECAYLVYLLSTAELRKEVIDLST